MKKTIPCTKFFVPINTKRKIDGEPSCDTRSGILHKIWKGIHGSFVLPKSVCIHDSGWEVYDMGIAGCIQCSKQHVCSDLTCKTECNFEGQKICTLTGLCVRSLVFSELEYVDTVGSISKDQFLDLSCVENNDKKRKKFMEEDNDFLIKNNNNNNIKRKQQRRFGFMRIQNNNNNSRIVVDPVVDQWSPLITSLENKTKGMSLNSPGISISRNIISNNNNNTISSEMINQIEVYVDKIICSSEWVSSIDMEICKFDAKQKACITKIMREYKRKNPGYLPNMTTLACNLVQSMGPCVRKVCKASLEERKEISKWCSESIFKHICLLNNVFRGAISESKLQASSIGLLYLMRQGIVMHGVVVLPKLHRLREILPIESHLQTIFGVKGKCITETENTVKAVMRSVDRESLKGFGVAGVDTLLMDESG